MTLQKLWFYARPVEQTLRGLREALRRCADASGEGRGGAVLDALHDLAVSSGDLVQREICQFLLERGAAPFLR